MTDSATRHRPPAGLALALRCAELADAKQAEEIVVLDLRGISQLTDYFVICSGGSLPHLRAIRDEVRDRLAHEDGVRAAHREDSAESLWVVLDYIDVMVHIFHRERRAFYALEELWSDAPRVDWAGAGGGGEGGGSAG